MSDPVFLVPLDKLFPINVSVHGEYWWVCRLGDVREWCQESDAHASESSARVAAVAHLADTHGIQMAGETETEWVIFSRDGVEDCRDEEHARCQLDTFYRRDPSAYVAHRTVVWSEWEQVD